MLLLHLFVFKKIKLQNLPKCIARFAFSKRVKQPNGIFQNIPYCTENSGYPTSPTELFVHPKIP